VIIKPSTSTQITRVPFWATPSTFTLALVNAVKNFAAVPGVFEILSPTPVKIV